MVNILVRRMQLKDLDEIMSIEERSFGKYHWTRQSFISEMDVNLGNYFTAADKDTGKVLGYSGFWLISDEAHITTVAVHPDYRKNKIGELLLQNMVKVGYEKKAKWFTLEVRAGNIAAQGLYCKYGFKSLGIRPKYYQDNDEDALIMWTENIWETEFKETFKKNLDELKTFFENNLVQNNY